MHNRHRQFKLAWVHMKRAYGWRVDWQHASSGENEEFYMVPGVASINPTQIENLQFFHSRAAMVAHWAANPSLGFDWATLWPMLLAQGWEQARDARFGGGLGFRYAPYLVCTYKV